MDTIAEQVTLPWPFWRKLLFRFFFAYLILQISPWQWLSFIPGFGKLNGWIDEFFIWLAKWANGHFFHIAKELDTVPNGSGDTSLSWTLLSLSLLLSAMACLVWSVIDRRRRGYTKLNYWLCVITRYYVATVAFSYGSYKLFYLQMPYPNLHQLATPLGDLLPMRLSWLFIGYSKSYEAFSGVMEIIAGLLLLFRRTATLGAMVAVGVFLNVMMLNLCYDIPVKIFSIQLTVVSLFLLANESERLIAFFILNKPTAVHWSKPWMRITAIVVKVLFITVVIAYPFFGVYQQSVKANGPWPKQVIKNGVYEVAVYKLNGRTLPMALSDTLRWQDIIFENGTGSVASRDTAFRIRYNRGYFSYKVNDTTHVLSFSKTGAGSSPFMSFKYQMPDSNSLTMAGTHGKDSLYVELKRTNRHF